MDDHTPIGYDGFTAPVYPYQVADPEAYLRGEPIINARDCELAGFDLADVLEAAKAARP